MSESVSDSATRFNPRTITRPDPVLLKYFFLCSLAAGPFFFLALLPLYFKYVTLRYEFDETGVSMKWGVFFRKEINLTYRRIQDIHLTRNIVQRWMGLATVAIQTASGSAGPEMSIEGILQADELRDYLYAQMRGARGDDDESGEDTAGGSQSDEALTLLREIRDLIQARSAGEPAS